jgi:phosphopantetheine adenylyltransferase
MLHNPDLKMVMFENFLNINNFIKSQQEFLIEKVEFDFNIILQYMDKSIAMYINTVFLMLSYSILESKLI